MAKCSKRSCSKGISLPPTKRFDFTMVDDDFEELQRGFVPKEMNADTKKCVKLFKDWTSARTQVINDKKRVRCLFMLPGDNQVLRGSKRC